MENSIETMIRRYIDLGKFLSLLVTESLYFACPCEFDDPYEGLLPRSHIEAESRIVQGHVNPILSLRNQLSAQSSDPDHLNSIDDALNNLAITMPGLHKKVSLKFGVSCWYKGGHESEAMWKLYSASGHGIAIESTIGRLQDSLKNTEGIIIDSVRYMDFDRDPIEKGHEHYGLFLKRRSFEHEKELRATIPLPQEGRGVLAPCDIDILITRIHLSSFVPVYFKDVVESICYGKVRKLQKLVVPLRLFDGPDYGINMKTDVET